MPLKVGDTLNYKGGKYLCVAIEKRISQELAADPGEVMRAALREPANIRYLTFDVGDFEKDEIITIDAEWCVLRSSNDIQLIYTKYIAKKEGDESGSEGNRSAQDVNQTPDRPAQAVDERAPSGEGARSASTS